MTRIPVDSADARELREAEVEREQLEAAEDRRHDTDCVGGWLGLDEEERPRICPRCRPHLLRGPCRLCSSPAQSCDQLLQIRRGRCCDHCDHRSGGSS